MKEGVIILAELTQANGSNKLRPVLLLRQLHGYNDFLVCGISTQLHQLIENFDELLDAGKTNFAQTGFRQSSIIRLSFLAVIPRRNVPGIIGRIDASLHKKLLKRLAKYLVE